ncbi:hypothetical protein ES703_24422 [subsurface metagenome]
MAKVIKLENIQPKDGVEQLVDEYACENCRHLINPNDKTCWQCGEKLEQSELVEHYHKGEKLNEGQFKSLKQKILI